MEDAIAIRSMTQADLAGVAKLFDAYRVFYEASPDPQGAQAFLRARLERNESQVLLAHSADGDILGFTQLYPSFSSTQMQKLWVLNDLYVEPAHRGRGISVQLIAAAKALCRQSGACGLMLETARSNVVGNALYPKQGFVLDTVFNAYHWSAHGGAA